VCICIYLARAVTDTPINPAFSDQSLVDCDKHDGGCRGGFLDNAWEFLQSTGAMGDTCAPYKHCKYTPFANCTAPKEVAKESATPRGIGPPPGPHPVDQVRLVGSNSLIQRSIQLLTAVCNCCLPLSPLAARSALTWTNHQCLLKCTDNSTMTHYKAASAYAVAPPGEGAVAGMQREIMTHGPIEVGFKVFADFMQYKGGVYAPSASSGSIRGGHAVKVGSFSFLIVCCVGQCWWILCP
jgi:hypothetical protein